MKNGKLVDLTKEQPASKKGALETIGTQEESFATQEESFGVTSSG